MDNKVLDHCFNQWRLRQPPDRIFEWGALAPNIGSGQLVLISKRFGDMTPEEQRTAWELKVWPAISAIE